MKQMPLLLWQAWHGDSPWMTPAQVENSYELARFRGAGLVILLPKSPEGCWIHPTVPIKTARRHMKRVFEEPLPPSLPVFLKRLQAFYKHIGMPERTGEALLYNAILYQRCLQGETDMDREEHLARRQRVMSAVWDSESGICTYDELWGSGPAATTEDLTALFELGAENVVKLHSLHRDDGTREDGVEACKRLSDLQAVIVAAIKGGGGTAEVEKLAQQDAALPLAARHLAKQGHLLYIDGVLSLPPPPAPPEPPPAPKVRPMINEYTWTMLLIAHKYCEGCPFTEGWLSRETRPALTALTQERRAPLISAALQFGVEQGLLTKEVDKDNDVLFHWTEKGNAWMSEGETPRNVEVTRRTPETTVLRYLRGFLAGRPRQEYIQRVGENRDDVRRIAQWRLLHIAFQRYGVSQFTCKDFSGWMHSVIPEFPKVHDWIRAMQRAGEAWEVLEVSRDLETMHITRKGRDLLQTVSPPATVSCGSIMRSKYEKATKALLAEVMPQSKEAPPPAPAPEPPPAPSSRQMPLPFDPLSEDVRWEAVRGLSDDLLFVLVTCLEDSDANRAVSNALLRRGNMLFNKMNEFLTGLYKAREVKHG